MKHLLTLVCLTFLLGTTACKPQDEKENKPQKESKPQNKNEALRSYSTLYTLERLLVYSKIQIDTTLEELKKSVKKEGNTRLGLESIKRAELLKQKTAQVLGQFDKVKRQLIREAGGGINPKTSYPKQALEVSYTQNIMRTATPKLSRELEKYVSWLNAEYKDLDLPKLEDLNKGSGDQDFYETFFADAHLGEVLIMLTNKQSSVIRYHSEVMKKLGTSF